MAQKKSVAKEGSMLIVDGFTFKTFPSQWPIDKDVTSIKKISELLRKDQVEELRRYTIHRDGLPKRSEWTFRKWNQYFGCELTGKCCDRKMGALC